MLGLKVEIEKPIDEKDIIQYENWVVMYAAVWTREFTKNLQAFPRLTGELEEQEYKAPIRHDGYAQASLLGGVEYAKYVFRYKQSSKWTNPNTIAHWYANVYRKNQAEIMQKAKFSASHSKVFYPHGSEYTG